MMVFHSKVGLAALVAGLAFVHKNPEVVAVLCARLWPQLVAPGQYVSLKHPKGTVICFCSGAKPEIVDNLFFTAGEVWGANHLRAIYVQEGFLAKWRAFLFSKMPHQRRLITSELRTIEHSIDWK
ncbi:MAG: hypothetical protein KGZ50_11080 [Peptococcaceae bacterium]|nr:hypothetical protein [Peptococcaceae bacterium]